MRTILTRLAVASVLVSGALLLHSDVARASASKAQFDSCQISCSTGSCRASASIWQFWEDCTCVCTPDGWPSCGC